MTPGCGSPMALGTPADPGRGFDDKDYDARALAIAMTYRDGQRQDFVLQNSPIFPVWPLEGFLLTVQLGIAKAQGQTAEEFIGQLPADQRAVLQHVLSHVRRFHRSPGVEPVTFTPMPDAYRLETYWSGKAHQLGVGGVPVKYIARPCNRNGTYVPTKAIDFAARSDDFLQTELIRHLDQPLADEPPACFDFYLQPLQAAAMTGPDGRVLPEDRALDVGRGHDARVEGDRSPALPGRPDHVARAGAAGGGLRRPGELHQLLDQHLARAHRARPDQPGRAGRRARQRRAPDAALKLRLNDRRPGRPRSAGR